MPTYRYKAVNKRGKIVRNVVEEGNRIQLIRKLKKGGLYPIAIDQKITTKLYSKKKKKRNVQNINEVMRNVNSSQLEEDRRGRMKLIDRINLALGTERKITSRDLRIFTQNFYLLKKANFNNVHALSTIIESTDNMQLVGILEDILAGVESGDYMYKTMEYYSDIFPYIYINMIKVGELSGSLETSLMQAVEYLDTSEELNKKIRRAIIPNLLMFAGIFLMLIVGTLFAIPQLQDVFDAVGTTAELPAITKWFQGVVEGFMKYWPIPTAILVVIAIVIIAYIRTPKGKYRYHYFKYSMPIFGELIFSLDFSRLMKAMLLNLKNGMRIQDALNISKSVVNNYVMLSMIENAVNNILLGKSWIEPFEKSGFASSMMIEMLNIGMQTDLTEMMEKLVNYMEIDIDNIIEKVMAVLPQVMYAIVGAILIFFVLVVLVPMIQVYMGSFLFEAYNV